MSERPVQYEVADRTPDITVTEISIDEWVRERIRWNVKMGLHRQDDPALAKATDLLHGA